MKKNVANILTFGRILGSFLLLLIPAFSLAFYITYLLCGFSDMIDGTIARKTNSTSKFGSQLDSVADLVFVAVSLIRWLPAFHIPMWLLIWCIGIAIIKISNIILGYIFEKQFLSSHTILNKVTGLLLFLLPLTLPFVDEKFSFIVVCFLATFAAIHEGVCIVTNATANRLFRFCLHQTKGVGEQAAKHRFG